MEAGVARGQAAVLVRLPHVDDDVIAFVTREAYLKEANNPGRFISALLKLPLSELDGFEPFRSGQERARDEQRRSAYDELSQNIVRLTKPEDEDLVRHQFEEINAVFPQLDDLARSGILTDEELRTGRWWDLFGKLWRGARRLARSRTQTPVAPVGDKEGAPSTETVTTGSEEAALGNDQKTPTKAAE